MRTFGIGYDHGNSTTTAVVSLNGQERLITFPSATVTGNLPELVKARKARGNDGIIVPYQALGKDEYVFEQDGLTMYVGKLALTQEHDASTGIGDTHRYGAPRNLTCLLTAAAMLVPDTAFELLVVTGLPYKFFDDKIKKEVKAALNGMHHFILNGRERQVYVKVGKILMEGAGASMQDEVFDHPEYLYGIIDVGGYSTDLYVSQGIDVQAPLCGGIDVGIEQAVEHLRTWFERSYGFPLSEVHKDRILAAYLTRGAYPQLRADGNNVPLATLKQQTEQAFNLLGNKITEFVSRKWKRGQQGKVASDFDSIQVIGGGTYYVLPGIQRLIPRAVTTTEPEYANARGYGWFADQLVQQRAVAAS